MGLSVNTLTPKTKESRNLEAWHMYVRKHQGVDFFFIRMPSIRGLQLRKCMCE
jgi:hypothetical protein